MHYIKRIEISNFRSIYHQEIECSDYNLFCGINDVGKSNVLKALNLYFNGETDFQTPLKFQSDYNKIALAKAQKSAKQKQQIKIKITFNVPVGYKSLSDLLDFSIEKVFDRYGKTELRYSDQNSTKRTSMSRIISKIKFVYIPALKGESVIQYLLGLLGDYQLIDSKDIENLNLQINNSTSDLTDLLNRSKIGMGTSFGLPTLLSDFWQNLSVSTTYEQFGSLESELEKSARVKGKNLNLSSYLIPLTMRGEGIKSKYIPPLLQWLQKNNKKSIFIWGIDEPENSLEFRASEELSGLFSNVYAKETQIFGTTHSMAFINPEESAAIKPVVFKCGKSSLGETLIYSINDLFKEESNNELLEEIGALQIQKQIIENYRHKINDLMEKNQILNSTKLELDIRLGSITKPLIITEGKTDWKHFKKALANYQLRNEYIDLDIDIYEFDHQFGDSELNKVLEAYTKAIPRHMIIGVFDCDESNGKSIHENGGAKKYKDNIWGISIPIPNFRAYHQGISVEFLYKDEDLKRQDVIGKRLYLTSEFNENGRLIVDTQVGVKNYHAVAKYREKAREKIQDTEVCDIHGNSLALSKDNFALNISNEEEGFEHVDFEGFKELFDRLSQIIGNN